MAMERFVKALQKPVERRLEGPSDVIPRTDKVRTFVTGSWLYSKESDLKNIIAREKRAFGKSTSSKEDNK